jgi:hypothetical protein
LKKVKEEHRLSKETYEFKLKLLEIEKEQAFIKNQ